MAQSECIVRNSLGQMVMARVAPTTGSFSPLEAEAINVREALSWLKDKGINKCIIESDSLHTIEGIRQKSHQSCFHLVIDNCKAMTKLLEMCSIGMFVYLRIWQLTFLARAAYSLSGLRNG